MIGLAIVGSGIFAKEQHLPAVQAANAYSLKATYSRSHKSASDLAEAAGGVDVYSDETDGKGYDALLQRDDIQAVIIALPIPNQPPYIKKALAAGKHVLAEKPISENIATAKELLGWYHANIDPSKVFFGIAENFRYQPSFVYGAEQVPKLGRVTGFRTRVSAMVPTDGKYYKTAWRKTPTYMGGFLLDGGVHFIAGTRLLLQPDNKIARVSSFSSQLQEHLAPLDTLDATVRCASGVTGTIAISFGTTFKGREYAIACENGTVEVGFDKVTVDRDGEVEVREFPGQGTGVKEEVLAFAKGIERGSLDDEQRPEEALRDLEVLEALLKSGEQDGVPIDLGLQ
ncbi:NAD(P)-binding protein [Eremomyces bilateralis CBS 781.70]|uniref:NAD(P)-binding protein n=1 Tax=Eremomyces bilateralis CBS 781.70 TaxID=1392243 RepID=A0A6G1GA25_9PEZI|nr:NAD(P)-binding protein [Eremomyces bilateralis CBS 781.70]KAF1814925.1 NAD(P)-binding protein [Eremomyces bilateralis CBS 781.70]